MHVAHMCNANDVLTAVILSRFTGVPGLVLPLAGQLGEHNPDVCLNICAIIARDTTNCVLESTLWSVFSRQQAEYCCGR